MVGYSLVILLTTLVEAGLVLKFGRLPYFFSVAIVGLLIVKWGKTHPPRPERLRMVGAVMLGVNLGFLMVIVQSFLTAPTTPKAEAPAPVDPTIARAEQLVNERRYAEASRLLEGCTSDACNVIQFRIETELDAGRR
jgi:hypothetical protein